MRMLASRPGMLALIFGAVTFATAALYAIHFSNTEPLQSDSEGYITFDLQRTIGYPVFLAMFREAGLGLKSTVLAQHLLFCGATLLLALETAVVARSVIAGGILLVGTFCNAELMRFSFLIMTESVAVTFCLLLLTLLLRFCRNPNLQLLFWMSTLAGLSLLVRPAFAPLFIVPILASMGSKLTLAARFVAIAGPGVACVLVGSVAQYLVHGYFGTQSFLGDQLIGKVGIYATDRIATEESAIIDRLRGTADTVQRLQKEVSGLRYRFLVTMPYYDKQRDNVSPLLEEIARATGKGADDVALVAAMDIAWAHPVEYLNDIWLNLYALWFHPRLMTQAEVDAFRDHLAKSELLPLVDESSFPIARPRAIAFAARALSFLALAATITALVLWLVEWLRCVPVHPPLAAAAAASAGVHGVFLLTAMVQAGLPRYAMVMWPLMVFAIVLLPIGVSSRRCSWFK
jgi:hypothetical protein